MLLLALLAGAAPSPAQSATKPVVFTAGDTQNIDSMNPLVGVSVPSYEAWNIQYATVTDKSPKDFSPIPGLAESWKGSADGKTWTYTMRAEPEVVRRPAADRRGRRLHDQPGQEGGVAELHLRRGQPHRQGHRRPHARRHVVGRRSQAPHAGHVRPAQAHLGEAGRQGDHEVPRRSTASARGRSRSSISRRASSRASRPTRTTTAASRPSTASCCATSTTPTRWSPRSSAGRSTPPRTCPAPPSTSWRRTRTSSPCRATRARWRSSRSTAARASRSRTPRCSTCACARRSPTRSTRRRSSTACSPAWARRARR